MRRRYFIQRFRVALTTRLESDAELFLAEVADVPLRWRRFLEFYDHSETRIRATAQVVFAHVVDSHRAEQELIELLSWLRDGWWLRLSPDDVDARNESFMDPQAFLELPCPVRRRMHAERALLFLEEHFGSQLVEYERNMVRARHDEEQFAGLWRIEMANAHAQAAAEQDAAVDRCRLLAAAAFDDVSAHAENRCERLEEGFVRERDCSAVADVVLADLGVQLREEQVMVSEFQDAALGMQAQVDEFVEQYAESTKRVIDQECSDVKKHERDLVENSSLGVARGKCYDRAPPGAPAGQDAGFSWIMPGGATAETVRVCSCGARARVPWDFEKEGVFGSILGEFSCLRVFK